MNSLKLVSGSIDLIKSTSGEYVFLEVNPVGEFDFFEFNAGFDIYSKIATKIIKYAK